jgi:hypothetical protein
MRSGRRDGEQASHVQAGVIDRSSQLLTVEPIVDVFANLIFCEAVTFLKLAFEPITAAVDDFKIVVSELSPLLSHFAFDLLPISF